MEGLQEEVVREYGCIDDAIRGGCTSARERPFSAAEMGTLCQHADEGGAEEGEAGRNESGASAAAVGHGRGVELGRRGRSGSPVARGERGDTIRRVGVGVAERCSGSGVDADGCDADERERWSAFESQTH